MPHKIVFKYLNATVDVAGEPKQISAASILVPYFEVYAVNANIGPVYIGDKNIGNDSTEVVPTPVVSGEEKRYAASEITDFAKGDYFDLSEFYVNADNNGDKIYIQYPEPIA